MSLGVCFYNHAASRTSCLRGEDRWRANLTFFLDEIGVPYETTHILDFEGYDLVVGLEGDYTPTGDTRPNCKSITGRHVHFSWGPRMERYYGKCRVGYARPHCVHGPNDFYLPIAYPDSLLPKPLPYAERNSVVWAVKDAFHPSHGSGGHVGHEPAMKALNILASANAKHPFKLVVLLKGDLRVTTPGVPNPKWPEVENLLETNFPDAEYHEGSLPFDELLEVMGQAKATVHPYVEDWYSIASSIGESLAMGAVPLINSRNQFWPNFSPSGWNLPRLLSDDEFFQSSHKQWEEKFKPARSAGFLPLWERIITWP